MLAPTLEAAAKHNRQLAKKLRDQAAELVKGSYDERKRAFELEDVASQLERMHLKIGAS